MSTYPAELTHGSGVVLTLEPGLAVAALRPQQGVAAGAGPVDLLAAAGLEPVEAANRDATAESQQQRTSPINGTDRIHWVRVPAQRGLEGAAAHANEQLGEQLDWLAPVYRFPGVRGNAGLVCCLPDSLLVRAADGASIDDLEKLLADLGLVEDQERSRYTAPFRYFHVQAPKDRDAYALRDELVSRGELVSEVRLETMPMLVPTTSTPNDPLLPQQWGIQQIQAPTAWDTTTGNAQTVVCILDEGCDLTHPDLRFSGPGINLATMKPDGSPTGNHGTACGGIAAAITNNNTGIAGVAGDSPILPLAFSNWTDVECAAGIRYAADHGAAVISMSFGVYGPNEGQGPVGWDFSIIDPAIVYAHDHDVVQCAATGNENISTHNRYPSRHPFVVACGASDQADNRKSPTSPDGETWWGSNFAPGVSLVAPGVLIQTTDRQGTAGYNTAPGTAGNYVANFNGTSSATPHIAGVVALMRACNPSLSGDETRELLERSADKVGTVPYATQPNFPLGTRNDEMGYGRANASVAVKLAGEASEDGQDGRRQDIALVRQLPGWASIPVAFANGDGTWNITNGPAPTFIGSWANTPGVKVVTGDFNKDGLTDIALVRQMAGWASIPVAFANGDGTWNITNGPAPTFIGSWANTPGARITGGDYR